MGKKGEKKEENKKRGRISSCCEKEGLRRGAWTAEEDKILVDFITLNGHGTWRNLPKLAGLLRCGKSCRLRWTNYLRPDIRRGPFTHDEENKIIQLHESLGNKWAAIASHLPGRTDNDVKNFWNSHLRKRFDNKTLDHPSSSSKSVGTKPNSPLTRHMSQWENVRVEAESRLSVKPLPLNLPPAGTTMQGDYFVNLWNSEVGQSFRNVNEFDSPTSQASSLTKAESCKKTSSPEISELRVDIWKCKKEPDDVADQMDDEMIELLLDFPVGENDMGFLQEAANYDIL
ncbi:hypothetical protein CASFOL_003184 [Castilleja foliolosa]|uniref:Uncharacterized protein n=1 Tax=Castilleja foliolosa TaxID=1961234 RepID=A0ABD3EGF3_9LAMI